MTVIRYLGGPTAVIEYGPVRLLVDPTFDPPGDYPIGDRKLVKTAGPALSRAIVPPALRALGALHPGA